MPDDPRRANRGPAAAAANRTAILDSARRLFAERGYQVALSAIAREARVGQGVLYRHFPSRLELGLAVLEDNLVELADIAAQPGPETFHRLWARLVELTVETAAFVEMAVDARRQLPGYTGFQRLQSLIATTLPRAREAGLVGQAVTVSDVLLAHRMIYGVVVTTPDPADVQTAVDEALRLLRPHCPPTSGSGAASHTRSRKSER